MSLLTFITIIGLVNVFAQSVTYKMSERNAAFAQQMQKEFVDHSIQNMEDADKILQLSDAQKDEIVYINLMYAKRTQILTENGASPAEISQHKSNMMEMTLNDYNRVLNESQKTTLAKNREILLTRGIE